MSKSSIVFAIVVFSLAISPKWALAENCGDKNGVPKQIKCLDDKIAELKGLEGRLVELEARLKGVIDSSKDQVVYVQNQLAEGNYCLQNDKEGGTSFVLCNIPERGQIVHLIKYPQ